MLSAVLTSLLFASSVILARRRTRRLGLARASSGAAATAGRAVPSSKAFTVMHAAHASLDGLTDGFQRTVGGLGISLLVYVARPFSGRSSTDPLLAIATP